MARFYGSIQGNRGEATRTGARSLSAHVRGWNVGARVVVRDEGDRDVVLVYRTGGSNNPGSRNCLARFDGETRPGAERPPPEDGAAVVADPRETGAAPAGPLSPTADALASLDRTLGSTLAALARAASYIPRDGSAERDLRDAIDDIRRAADTVRGNVRHLIPRTA